MHVDQKHSIFALLRIGALVFGFSSTLIVYFTSRPLNVFYLLYAWIILPWIVRLFFITAPKLFKKHSRSDLKVVDWINQQGMGGVKLDFFALKIATLQFSIIYMLTGLATLFVSAMFSDFYFCWASSFDLKSDDVARFFRLIELPWSSVHEWLNFDIISSSRFNQLSGAYSNPTATVASANWIGFIGTATAFYGILPRLVEFGYIQMKQKLRPADSNAALMESEAPWQTRLLGECDQSVFVNLSNQKLATPTSKKSPDCCVFIVDAFESPDHNFIESIEPFLKKFQRFGVMPVQLNSNSQVVGPNPHQKKVWQSIQFHQNTFLVEYEVGR